MIKPNLMLASGLFDTLRERTADEIGVTRAAYSPEEATAHALVADAAASMGLEVETDAAGNLYMTLPGADREGARTVIGSHMDSVPRGGNFDGAAGVIAGVTAMAALVDEGVMPRCDITVMAIRAEEGVWFPHSYIGSRMAFGMLEPGLLDTLRRSDTGRTLAEHIGEAGFDPDAVRAGAKHLRPDTVAMFIEPHIEQGPVLVSQDAPVGVVTAIRGNFRYRRARCLGEYGHSGTVPLALRRDAVVATAELVTRMQAYCLSQEEDATVTFGKFATDSAYHGFSRVAGTVDFAVDVRSQSAEILAALHEEIQAIIGELEAKTGVRFELDDYSEAGGAAMDKELRQALCRAAHVCGVPMIELPSGAGHDAAFVAQTGVPTAMLFIRNEHGSHNPDELMTMEDFAAAVSVLVQFLLKNVV